MTTTIIGVDLIIIFLIYFCKDEEIMISEHKLNLITK